ncbi:MAG: molybdopterin-dependent oxidoreductase [bacterium]|nr:molybdopterin-dependent oxidoreductase [bacterium]
MAKLTIDGKEIEVPDGTGLFDACRIARGEPLPHFCYHPDLSIAGVCRLCQVEVEGMPKLTIACNTGVRDGMVVHTRNERVTKASQQILEMHLINHPVDCPICDQAGECGLQNQYMKYGLYDSKVQIQDKVEKDKAKVIGPHVIHDNERCVLCSRCVRFCDEYTKTNELGIFNRGNRAEVSLADGVELDNNYSMNTVDLCPVGALTSRDFRFQKRVWMLKAAESICTGCSTGCNVRVDYEADRIFRLKPRFNPDVNGRFMCDKGRMTYKAVHSDNRLGEPEFGGKAINWVQAIEDLQEVVARDKVGLIIGSAHQSVEELHLLKVLKMATACPELIGGLADSDKGEADELLVSADRTPNRKGLELLDLPEVSATVMAEKIKSAIGTVVILGGDPAENETVAEALKTGPRVLYIGTHRNKTTELASHILPGCTWAEKGGIFVNKDNRLQEFKPALRGKNQAREDWRVLGELLAGVGVPQVPDSLSAIREALNTLLFSNVELNLNQLTGRGVPVGGEAE